MSALLGALLGAVVTLHRGERGVALLMFAYSFLAMTAWNILRPLTRSRFIADYGAENAPIVLLAAGVLIGVLMHQYTRAIRHLPRALIIPATLGGLAALLVVFWAVLRTNAAWGGIAFYFVGLVLGILLISQFWTLANDIYDARQAKRIFGFIGGGASLGGALGSGLTAALVARVGPEQMILVGAGVLVLCVFVVRAILRRHDVTRAADLGEEEEGVSAREAWRLIRTSRHLKIMALVIGFAAAGAQVIDQQLNMAAEASYGADGEAGIAAFLARVTLYLSLAGFVVQMALTRWIHRAFGLAAALLLLPVALGATATVVLVTGAVWAVGVARVLDATLRYTVDKTTREVLFLPLSPELKYRAKPFIDVTADRAAKAVTALALLVLIKPWGLGLDWRSLSYASLVLTAVWIGASLLARREYLAAFRRSIGSQAIAPETMRTDVGDAVAIEALVEELSNPDPSAVLYAIGMLETLDKRHLISPLLLHHEAPEVRARVLGALESVRSRIAVRWRPSVERLVHDADVNVRAAALHALARLAHQDALALMRRHLSDPEPRVVVTACVGLASSPDPADADAADAALQRLIADTRDAGAAGRMEAAIAIAHLHEPRFRSRLVPLLYDRDPRVVEPAIRSARALGASDGLFVPGLLSLLGNRVFKGTARDALVAYGPAIVPALAHVLGDTREELWIRRHVPATLAAIPVQASMDALVESLDDPDGFLRYKSIAAIERLRRDHPELTFATSAIERLVLAEAGRYYAYLALRHDVVRADLRTDTLLARAMAEKLERTLDRIYRLLGLLYHADDVRAARSAIEHGSPRRRAAAVEYLDNLLTGTVRKRVLPLVDETPPSEKLRAAYLARKTRPRDLVDALAQLVHDEDPVVAAAAVHLALQRDVRTLSEDLRFLVAHRPPDDPAVEAAIRVLDAHRLDRAAAHALLPRVELVARIQAIPLFAYVSVDELFRIVSAGHEWRQPPGRELFGPGAVPAYVEFLVEGSVMVTEASGAVRRIDAPGVLGLEDVLQGAPATCSVRARDAASCFRIPAGEFLTSVSNNVLLAQGLFRMLLHGALDAGETALMAPSVAAEPPLQPFDQALQLRQHPLLSRASPAQLVALIGAGRDVPLTEEAVLFDPDTPAAIYQVLAGGLLLESAATGPQPAGPGAAVNVASTLAGGAAGCRAVVTQAGRALRIDRDDLFAVLTDDVELMQGLFSDVLAYREAVAAAAGAAAMPAAGTRG